MHNHVPIFRIGDMILVDPSSRKKEEKIRAQIVSFRTENELDPRARRKRYGCDVITEEGQVRFISLDDIVAWNPHKVKEWFK